ncbi:MAG: hypothetical protein ACOY90_06660 [Candidatus Zhuqueibacterota bacterium]
MNEKNVTCEDKASTVGDCLSLNELISYSRHNIRPEQKEKIDLHIRHCPFCADAIEGFQKSAGELQFRTAIAALQTSVSQRLSRTKSGWRNPMLRYGMAALVIVALATSFLLLKTNQTHQRIFNQFFEAYPNITPIVRGESSQGLFLQAMLNYEKDQIAACQQLLDQLLAHEPGNAGAHFYAGMCQLINDTPQLALPHFEAIMKTHSSPYRDPAQWYQGLALVRLERIPEAMAVFQSVSAASKYRKQSEQILNLLTKR